ncbi:MAG TPA: hypothetical protein DD412_00280 [Holosporales bacterium]|nr:hypothetical protein [Holosporales bacterium]
MAENLAGNRKSIAIGENDVALIFKEDGHVDLSFPEMTGDHVPEHVMAALVLSYAVVDEEFFALIQDRFAQQASVTLEEEVMNSSEDEKEEEAEDLLFSKISTPPHLTVVS